MSLNLYTSQQLMNKEMKKKFTKTFDLSQIAEDPMDSYLDTLGLWKKRIARDGSCLFRAVAEQIYPCQLHHERVRQECVRYMTDHKEDFSKFLTNISFEEYLEAMKNPLEYAGQLEISAMSKLYNRDFMIYQHPDQPGIDVTQNGYEKKIYLCYSYNNHFDAIFTKAHRDCLALIQSFVYEILYDKVFGSGEQVAVARRLLRKSDTIYPKEYMRGEIEYEDEDDSDLANDLDEESSESIENIDFEDEQHSILMTDAVNESNSIKTAIEQTPKLTEIIEETVSVTQSTTIDQNNNETQSLVEEKSKSVVQMNQSLSSYNSVYSNYNDKSNIQKMPLPYKVAKSLDPVIYRNTAFDAWQAAKKEYEEAINQKAVSILQTGDKCLVKLNNNYSEKWNLAYVQNIQQDIANVFVVELNENHCVGLENLKPYKSGNEMALMHHNSFNGYQTNSMMPMNNVQNVHKLVQSINAQFSKIFVSTDNKRRNVKKKQFNSMKKSSSFHAFSTELPTLIEVEEQLAEQDPFHYGNHYYLNNPHNQAIYHAQHQQHSLPHHSMGYHTSHNNPNNPMNNQFGYLNHQNAAYSSLPHSQQFNDFNDSNNNKNKLCNSLSANNLNQFNSMPTNIQGQVNNNNQNNTNMTNKNIRRQRYPQNPNMNFNNSFNGGLKQPWNNNFPPGPMGHPTPGFLPPPLLHHQMSGPQHQAFNAGMGPMGPLGPNQFMHPPPALGQMHPANGPMPPPFMHQGPPQMPMPPLAHPQASSGPGHRPNFFNPISSFMFGPPSHSSNHLGHNSGHNTDHNNNYYFPSASNSNQSQTQHNNKNSNQQQHQNNQRGRNDKNADNFLANSANTNNGSKSVNNGYQQVPNHLQSQTNNSGNTSSGTASSGLLNMPPPTTTASSSSEVHPTQTLPNTSNYLLMPAPQNNNSSTNNGNNNSATNNTMTTQQQQQSSTSSSSAIVPPAQSSSSTSNYNSTSSNGMTKSHSYHSGVSAQSYDVTNSNSSNVYVDVYQPHMNTTTTTTNNNNGQNNVGNNPNVPNILPGTVNPHNNLLMQSYSMIGNNSNNFIGNSHYTGNGNSAMGLESSSYGTNTFQSYEAQYPRFENNGFAANQNGLLDENLTNSTESRHNNLWNKSNKLTKNNSLFNDMVYTENSTNQSSTVSTNNQNNNQYYTNCFVVNIDGPINFNATHSLLDDGSDLPMSDVNTIRFFYNLGIEYYRLNLATPYNQGQNYYAPSATGPANISSTNSITNTNISSSSSTQLQSTTTNTTTATALATSLNTNTKLKDDSSIGTLSTSSSNTNSVSGHVSQQVVPQANLNKPLIQHSYTSRRVVH